MKLSSSRKAQSMLEYAALVTVTILVMVLAGPYVIRSLNAHFKFWDDASRESLEDPLMEAPLQDLDSTCRCSVPEPAGCGAGECPPTQMLMYSNCNPLGCEHTLGFTTRSCVADNSCCFPEATERCGQGTTAPGDCPVGNRIYTDSCEREGQPVTCVADELCDPRCLGIYADAPGSESSSVPVICPNDDVSVVLPVGKESWDYDRASNFVGLVPTLKGTSTLVCTEAAKCETYCVPGYAPDASNTRCEGECGTTQEVVTLDTRDFVNVVAPEWARNQGYYLNTHDDFRGDYDEKQSIEQAAGQICRGYNPDWESYSPPVYGCISGVPHIARHNGDWEFSDDGQGWCGGDQAVQYVQCIRTVPIDCPACAPICEGATCAAEIAVTFQLEYFGGDTQCRKGRSATPHTITIPVAPMEPNTARKYVITTDPKVRKEERCGIVYCPFIVTANASGNISGPSTSINCHKAVEDTECYIKSYPDTIYRSGRKGNGWRDIRLYQRELE